MPPHQPPQHRYPQLSASQCYWFAAMHPDLPCSRSSGDAQTPAQRACSSASAMVVACYLFILTHMVLAPVGAGRLALRDQERHMHGLRLRRRVAQSQDQGQRGVHLLGKPASIVARTIVRTRCYPTHHCQLTHCGLALPLACAHAQVAKMSEGGIFGESALSTEAAYREATVFATSPHTVCARAVWHACVDAVDDMHMAHSAQEVSMRSRSMIDSTWFDLT